jgi:hypothetical protein
MEKTLQITADFQVGPDVKYTNILGRFFSTACLRLNYKVMCSKEKVSIRKICHMELKNFFLINLYTVKKVSNFSVPSGDVTCQTLPRREK